MARLSDLIESMLKEMIDENNGSIEITRAHLADRLNCVPSQITYVLSTRFTNGQGYIVESRRGGGGWIRINRIAYEDTNARYVMHTLNAIGDRLTQHQAEVFITNFVDYGIIKEREGRLLMTAVSDKTLGMIEIEQREILRMVILKQLFLQICMDE